MRYFIELSYFGKSYHGWQRQPNAVTVQQTIEEALSTILRHDLKIMGAGRTDTGVHATQMYAHVDFDFENAPSSEDDLNKLTHKLNRFLPPDIAIRSIFKVSNEAHTRFDATARSYVYRVALDKNPFTTDAAFYCKSPLDIDKMNSAAQILMNYCDFECFSKSKTDVNTYLCNITEARWEEVENELEFHITADRFLRNMVRAIVGTLIEIGQGKQPVEWIHEVIASKTRGTAGTSVPAQGLYLTKIEYLKTIF
ncbi:tRNA pseudouridine(38-40) synthase TruA [Dokdonia sinensis]|uniref:tRNA pseudouridine synthase A n=1 Tax=Dokdonia sinensis TaxID=2479847 RepID=A0A3M0FUK5_9FLAO|nr:tRNA pseudouridine(38-40) synthase TruA [Dokdonia sinensis]RMB56374.1 tRNA pseudouridine(38-40) synthase TruA [Dokdonia sinensis]